MLAGRHLWERSANRHTSRSTSATDCQVAHHRVTCSISCRAAAWFVRQFSTSESDWLESVDDSPEKDVAFFYVGETRIMMKIDYYDENREYGSEDPADPEKTRRVITLMLPSDF